MKIGLKNKEEIITTFISGKDLIDYITDNLGGEVTRVELKSSDFKKLLFEVDFYTPAGIDSNSPEDYSGCYVLLDNRWCIQTSSSYL